MASSATAVAVTMLVISLPSIFANEGSTVSEEKSSFLISSSAPAAPPESAEARVALRQHREATALNRYTFKGNVLEGVGDIVEHWIVMFCPGWHDKCQGLLPSYELLGMQWENKLNKAVMESQVRFAKVDCATDKALCVSLDVDDYPSVVHYHKQQRVASWHGGAPGLVRFVKQELEASKRRASSKTVAAQSRKAIKPVCGGDITFADTPAEVGSGWWHFQDYVAGSTWRSLCFTLLLLAATRSVWTLAFTGRRTRGGAKAVVRQPAPEASAQRSYVPREWSRSSSSSLRQQSILL
jgi:hypothetical protein